MTHVEVRDVTGGRWVGDSYPDALTAEQANNLRELLSDFKALNYISLEVGGVEHFFNPAHVVVVSVHT